MARYKKIFAALDAGESRMTVARRALSIAHDNKAEVLFAHALESAELEMGRVDLDMVADKSKQAIEAELERQLAKAASDENIPSVEVCVRMGRIDETLGEMAADFQPDLVICGVRGLSNFKYAIVGSISMFLVRNMACDVLVVRPDAIDEIDESEYEPAE